MTNFGQSIVRVRKSASKIVEIKCEDDDNSEEEVEIDEVDHSLEILSAEDAKSDVDDPPLDWGDATCYRSVTARLNYIAPDLADIQYATKEAARHMAIQRASHLAGLQKIGKYLAGPPQLVMHFKWQKECDMVIGYIESDWAGCMATAKSTSGIIIAIGTHAIKT